MNVIFEGEQVTVVAAKSCAPGKVYMGIPHSSDAYLCVMGPNGGGNLLVALHGSQAFPLSAFPTTQFMEVGATVMVRAKPKAPGSSEHKDA